jgi:hypothetical protein
MKEIEIEETMRVSAMKVGGEITIACEIVETLLRNATTIVTTIIIVYVNNKKETTIAMIMMIMMI